jgi:ribonuclease Z
MAGEDELEVAGLTLRGVTRGGIRTCIMVPQLDLMFDVGGPAHGQLKFGTILVSHGHQDHLGELPYLISQRQLAGLPPPTVHVPREIDEPLRRILAAWGEIEGFTLGIDLVPHDPGDTVEISRSVTATCFRTTHRVPSLAWLVTRTSGRLRAEYVGRSGTELGELRRQGFHLTEPHVADVLCVTGDTQIELFLAEPRVRACKVLVHRSPRHTRSQAEDVVARRFPAAVRDKVHVFGR